MDSDDEGAVGHAVLVQPRVEAESKKITYGS
jgi:hypothetical protein